MNNDSIAKELRRSNLSAFAIVEAQLTKGLQHPTDYLLPFFQEMIRRKAGQIFSVQRTVDNILEEFSLNIPVYLADSLIQPLTQQGYLEYDRDLKCNICQNKPSPPGEITIDSSDFNAIENSLGDYADSLGMPKPLNSKDWIKALLAFFSQEHGDVKVTQVGTKFISIPKENDDRLISKFIVYCERNNPTAFDLIKKIYTGFTLVDTIVTIQNTGHVEDWNTLKLVYDSTVLMRILGTSGSLLKKATLEMHTMLQDMGCSTYYFDHTLMELYANIEGLVDRYSRGDAIHRETAQALSNGEITIGRINLLKGNADLQLGSLNISQLDLPPRSDHVAHQISPTELEDFLKSRIRYRIWSDAARADSDSIEKLIFLRRGKKSIDLPKSKYIFVTHNTRYARASKEFAIENCGYGNRDTPPIIILSTLTKLSWLATDRKNPDFDLSKDLIANCFQASLPDERWFNKFWQTIESSHPELIDPNVHDSLYLLDVRRAADDASLGDSALFDDIDFPTLIANAKSSRSKREKMHKREMEEVEQRAKSAVQAQKERMEAIQLEHERQLRAMHQKATTEQDMIKGEYELAKKQEIHLQEQQHLEELSKKVKEAKDEVGDTVKNQIAEKASKQAKSLSRIATLILAGIFSLIFILSFFDPLQSLFADSNVKYIKIVAGLLGAIQIVGLFVERFSFLFLGPLIERKTELYLKKHYLELLPVKKRVAPTITPEQRNFDVSGEDNPR